MQGMPRHTDDLVMAWRNPDDYPGMNWQSSLNSEYSQGTKINYKCLSVVLLKCATEMCY